MKVKMTNKSQMLEYRTAKVCHPLHTGKEYGAGEEWIVPFTMKVPLNDECVGEYAVLHHDIMAGAVGKKGEIVINTDGWKSPSLREAINAHILPNGWNIDREWYITTPTGKYPVIDYMQFDSAGRLVQKADLVDEWTKRLNTMPSKIKWYAQLVKDLLVRNEAYNGPDLNVGDSADLEKQVNDLVVSSRLLRQVCDKFNVEDKPSKQLNDAVIAYLTISMGLPFEV